MSAMEQDKSYLRQAEKILEQLKNGTAPWVKPWEVAPSAPFNPVSGVKYRGINAISLHCEGKEDPRWMTYKQAASKEYQVRKGEKGSPIVFWQFAKEIPKKDSAGRPVKGRDGKTKKELIKLRKPRLFRSTVFNADQIEGIAKMEEPPRLDNFEINKRVEGILEQSGASISYGGDRAFYSLLEDRIQLPEREAFKSEGDHYATALHELGHWSGHESRLDRDLTGSFGSPAYASEELRAEIYSYMMSSELSLPHDPSNHIAYIDHWIQKLEEDPLEIYRASKDADEIKTYTLGFDHTLEQTQEQTQEQAKEQQQESDKAGEVQSESGNYDIDKVRVVNTNRFTGEVNYMDMVADADKVAEFLSRDPDDRETVQDAFPNLSTDERDFLLTGLTPDDRDRMFGKTDEVREPVVVRDIDIVKDLKQACESAGLVMKSDPVIDGTFKRVPVERPDGKRNTDGSYKAFSDGRPAGIIVNHYTGEKVKWKVGADKPLTTEERSKIARQSQANKERREKETIQRHAHKARRAEQLLAVMPKATDNNQYLKNKGITASENVFEDKRGRLVVPITDVNGKTQSLVRINGTGSFKSYQKGARKGGGMHLLGKPKAGDTILVAEGYSTAKTLRESTGMPVAAAFDANNLASVALAVQQAYTTATVFIAGDDDRENERNIGRTKANDAARAVNSRSIFPSFSQGEKGSDFNDLSQSLQKTMDKHSASQEVKRQILTGIRKGRGAEKHQTRQVKAKFDRDGGAKGARGDNVVKTAPVLEKTSSRSR